MSFSSVTVNVCGAPTRFVADGVMRDPRVHPPLRRRARSSAPVPSVFRVRVTPATARVVCALTTVTPVTADVRLIVQEPVPPDVVHGFADVNAARAAVDREADLRPVRRIHEAGAVVDVHVRRERMRLTDPVHAVRRDLDVRVDDLERLAGTVGREVSRIARVVRPERVEAGRRAAPWRSRSRRPGRSR